MSIFSSIEILTLDFAPTQVFHLVDKMLEGKLPMPSLEVAQAIIEPSTKEDLAKFKKLSCNLSLPLKLLQCLKRVFNNK